MKRIFVCSRLRGDILRNIKRAEFYCHSVTVNFGHSAFAPHLLFTRFLDDTIPSERELGIAAGEPWLRVSEEVWVFVVDGFISTGMRGEVDLAIDLGIPVKWFAVDCLPELHTLVIHPLAHLSDSQVPTADQLLAPRVAAKKARATFADVEAKLKAGGDYLDCLEDLDAVLGTTMPERDRDAEAAWEGNQD